MPRKKKSDVGVSYLFLPIGLRLDWLLWLPRLSRLQCLVYVLGLSVVIRSTQSYHFFSHGVGVVLSWEVMGTNFKFGHSVGIGSNFALGH